MAWFGRLNGVSGLRPVRTFELRPFAVTRLTGGAGAGSGFFGGGVGDGSERRELELRPDVGVDAKLGLTSRLMLDATVNPDFGQVEADQVELNLSRFETFFPEKRPFFLEGTDVYQTPVQLFYSRRIGKPLFGLGTGDQLPLGDGSEVIVARTPGAPRIWAASKLTGALTENLSVGLLAAVVGAEQAIVRDAAGVERELELAPERSFGVLRLRQSLGDGAYVGAMATAVNRLGDGEILRAEANHDAYSQGLDGFWYSGDGGLRVNGQLVLSQWAGGPGHHDADDRACTPSPADPTCLPIARLDGTIMGPGAFGYGGSGEMEMRRGHLLLDAEASGAFAPAGHQRCRVPGTGQQAGPGRGVRIPGDPPARLVPELRPAGHGRDRAQLGRRLRGVGAGAVWRGSVSQLPVQRDGAVRAGCPAGTSSRPRTAGASNAAGATAPA